MKLPLGRPILVTSGLPYANGYAHVGHLRTYVPADFFVRYLRKLGEEVVYVCGSDVHGTPIVIRAEEEGVSPREVVEKYHRHFQEIFRMMNIEFDNYGRTDSEFNVRRTQE
ncbi:MAG: methionyl-tRNA synthetase, partial [Archaeoglobi archaeon]|nr:methionyl-tRNA synthetase [Archaeoglobi archaeon]